MIDTHVHLNFGQLANDLEGVLERATQAGVTRCIVPGTTVEESTSGVELSELHDTLYAGIGVHPCEVGGYDEVGRTQLKELLGEINKVVAIGEVGLDYYHFENAKSQEQIETIKKHQQMIFTEMIELAKSNSLPLIIHSREATSDCQRMLRELAPDHPTVIHCFVGNLEEAQVYLDMGCLLSFTNIITYKKNEALREVVKQVPLERILIETDGPFLPPEGMRGEVCEPMHVRRVAECIAEVKGIAVEEVDRVTTATAKDFFGI